MKTAIEFVDQFATYDTYEAVRDSKKFALRAMISYKSKSIVSMKYETIYINSIS